MKVMETQSARRRVESGSEGESSEMEPACVVLKNRTFSQDIIFVFFIPSDLSVVEYSHDRMAKNMAPTRRSPRADFNGVDLSDRRVDQTDKGKHAWLRRGGSEAAYALRIFLCKTFISPCSSLSGSFRRFCLKVETTFEMVVRTVEAWS